MPTKSAIHEKPKVFNSWQDIRSTTNSNKNEDFYTHGWQDCKISCKIILPIHAPTVHFILQGVFMATKTKSPASQFVCSSCGYTAPKWLGRCPDCGEFNTMQEEIVRVADTPKTETHRGVSAMKTRALPLSKIGYESSTA